MIDTEGREYGNIEPTVGIGKRVCFNGINYTVEYSGNGCSGCDLEFEVSGDWTLCLNKCKYSERSDHCDVVFVADKVTEEEKQCLRK